MGVQHQKARSCHQSDRNEETPGKAGQGQRGAELGNRLNLSYCFDYITNYSKI